MAGPAGEGAVGRQPVEIETEFSFQDVGSKL